MLYEFFRLPLILLIFSFYKRIYWSNSKRLPKKGPVIIIVNHSTAFVEQILLASFLRRGIYFWVKAAVFTSPLAKWFFRQMHILPIMRAEDGLKNPHQNKATFEESARYLQAGRVLLIAPEGNSVMEKRLRRFRTGTARLALAAQQQSTRPIKILPIGVNYSHHQYWRSDVMLSFGKAIEVKAFQAEYEKDPQRAARILSKSMYKALRQEVIHLELEEDEHLFEQLLLLDHHQRLSPVEPWFTRKGERLRREQGIAQAINELDPAKKLKLKVATQAYFQALKKAKIEDASLCTRQQLKSHQKILLYLGAIPAFLGYCAGFLPLNLARYLRKRLIYKLKDMHFWAPIGMVLTMLTWLAYMLLLIVGSFWYFGAWTLTFAPIGVALHFWQIRHADYVLAWRQEVQGRQLARNAPEQLNCLQRQRTALLQLAKKLKVLEISRSTQDE